MARAKHDDEYFDLGTYSRKITPTTEAAKTWFDRGLVWTYAFNHDAATDCFEKAIAEDENCIMAYWGVAYSVGPNYNKPWESFDEEEYEKNLGKAVEAVKRAQKKAAETECLPVEKQLIDALQFRYQPGKAKDRSKWNTDYADAMKKVYEKDPFPYDLDVAALYADALMMLSPWGLWDVKTGKPADGARTRDVQDVLVSALKLKGADKHPGLLHLYIHFMEMSSTPEKALPTADNLRGLVPDGGHLQHMPSHIDILCGDYGSVVSSNAAAIRADKKWLAAAGPLNFYSLYRAHDYHFRIYGAMFSGQCQAAIATAEELEVSIPEELLQVKSPPMADWLEGFYAMKQHVWVRFGKWDEIMAQKLPKNQELYCTTTALIHYAKAIAYACWSKTEEAERERNFFHHAVEKVPDSRTIFNNTCKDILAVAAATMDGEVEVHKGNLDVGFEYLKKAVELSDNLPYDEPWGWMQPPRHAYGALLSSHGRYEEALPLYMADLGFDDTLPRALQHPNNVWALAGLERCLRELGRTTEARIVKKQLDLANARADMPISCSCMCAYKASIISISDTAPG